MPFWAGVGLGRPRRFNESRGAAWRANHRRDQGTVAEPLGSFPMRKPSKTAAELEAAIKVEMEDIREWPTDVGLTVLPEGDTWKVVIMPDNANDDRDLFEMISLIADRLRSQFDLRT